MRGKDTDTLKALVTAASGWRTAAAGQNVTLFQLNATMPDGRAIVLFWSEADNDWTVQTQG